MKINTKKYIESFLKIKTKDSKLQILRLNEPQKILYNAIEEMSRNNKPIRIIVLKARQQGASTLASAIIFKRTVTNFNVNSAVLAHDIESTNKVFEMYKLFYQKLPIEMQPCIKANNAKILEFDNEQGKGLKSNIRCMTAGTSGVGRGSTIQNLHLSEFAFWGGDKWETFNGIMQSVPNTLNSMVIIESTANGFNEFQEIWQKSINGENDFKPVFIAWYKLNEYRMLGEIELTEEEQILKKQFNLDNDQLNWRRWCIKNNCGGDINKFRQEYPSTPEEAFVSTGDCYFNTQDIIDRTNEIFYINSVTKGYFSCSKSYTKDGEIFINNIRFIEDENGMIELYSKPVKDRRYTIGADTAGEGSDKSVGQAIDSVTIEQTAKLSKEKICEDDFAEQLYCLGIYFNFAMIGVETNFNRYVVTLLQKMNYPNLYMTESVDKIYNTIQNSFGFKTTSVTRPVILSEFRIAFKENKNIINSLSTLNEMRTFILDNNGKAQAMVGKHDDEVMAFSIACHIRQFEQYKPASVKISHLRI